jgi:hypothetical protein
MDCNQVRDYLVDSVLGGAIPTSVASHLASCPSCRREKEELDQAWTALDRVQAVRFPRSLARETVRIVAEEEKIASYSPRRLIFAPPAMDWRTGLAALAAAAAAVVVIYYALAPKEDRLIDQMASTFQADSSPLPDPAATLASFLGRAEEILSAADRGGYPRWGDVFRDIFGADLEGQARYLLDAFAPDAPARPAVQSARDALWALLQAGRGKEGEAVVVPANANVPEALRAIRTLREAKPKD